MSNTVTIIGGKIEVNEAVRALLIGHMSRFTVERVEDGPRAGVPGLRPGEGRVYALAHGERQATLAYASGRS